MDQRGDIERSSMENAFRGCENLAILATDRPLFNPSAFISFASAFEGAKNLTGNIGSRSMIRATNLSNIFSGATNFNQDLSTWILTNATNLQGAFNNTSLSTYNYNQILASWSMWNLQTGVVLGVGTTKYGGCELNAQQGIQGRERIQTVRGWTVMDGGFDNCGVVVVVDLSYSPSTPTNKDVTATLTISHSGSVLSPGWTATSAKTFTKTFPANVENEVVNFQSIYGYTGFQMINISRIDKTPIQANITYSTNTFTSGNVIATISFNKTGVVTVTNNS